MQRKFVRFAVSSLCALVLCSCASNKSNVVQVAQTVVGISLSYNPLTQLPEVLFGFARNVIIIVPTDRDKPNGLANTTPDLAMSFIVDASIINGIKISDKFAIGSLARHGSNEIFKTIMSNDETERALFAK